MSNLITEHIKKEKIIEAATKLFFERGYEATSIRMIQKEAGYEIGLFYYYFKGKKEAFNEVLEEFFCRYEKEVLKIIENGKRDPFRILDIFFEYIKNEIYDFRKKYLEKMNERIRLEIRVRTLKIIERYLRDVLEILVGYGAKPIVDLKILAITLANSIGHIFLYEENFCFERRKAALGTYINMMMWFNFENSEIMFADFAEDGDIESIMELACEVKSEIGDFDEGVFKQAVFEKISRKEIFVIRNDGSVIGCLAFSKNEPEIEFLATLKEWRGVGVASRLIITALAQYPLGAEISVITYLEDDEKGKDALRLYRKFGFENYGIVEKFGQKRQRMMAVVKEFAKI